MPTEQRNYWQLPRHNFKEKAQCIRVVESWKRKANKHAMNAGRTKYALMCFLEGNVQETPAPGENVSELIPLQDDPVFTGTEEEIKKQENENKLFFCGICQENQVKVGRRKPVIYNCGHSNCAECFNGMIASGRTMACPYCRVDITKAVRLFID